jgi:hypothetical protein
MDAIFLVVLLILCASSVGLVIAIERMGDGT